MGLEIGRPMAAPSFADLRSRFVSALVLGFAVLAVTAIGGMPFRLLCCVAGVLVCDEWARMTRARRAGPLFKFLRRALFFALVAFFFGQNALALLIVAIAMLFALFVDRGERKADWAIGGLFYAALAALAPGILRGDDLSGLAVLGFVICIVWPTDIFAYFVGKTFGGPKILPHVSPKKTISGSFGGLIAGMAFGSGFYVLVTGEFHVWILSLTALLSILGQAGDLFESWVKRRFGVKDSGRIIPGHGGLMDRIDALIVALAAAFLIGVAMAGLDHPAHFIFSI